MQKLQYRTTKKLQLITYIDNKLLGRAASTYQLTLSRRLRSANHSTILSATKSGEFKKVRYVNKKSSTYFGSTAEWSSTKCRTSLSGVP